METFKVIIAGSRTFKDYELLKEKCDNILSHIKDKDKEIWIVSGTAEGADRLGERYAQERGYYLLEVPANWDDVQGKPRDQIGTMRDGRKYWKRAGHIRNEKMALLANALIAFNKGTPGTVNMINTARNYNLKIREIKVK
jgi:hypothetical protein